MRIAKQSLAACASLLVFCLLLALPQSFAAEAPEDQLTIGRAFDAYSILRGIVRETPLLPTPIPGGDVYLKLENLQTTGAFKLRGAYYAISQLSPEQKKRGVVTCSAGNHAQGVGYAAREFGVKATIFIPKSAPRAKVEATKALGAEVRLEGANFGEAKAAAEAYVKESGKTYVPPYDDINVIAGQGSIAWEILRQLPETDAVVVPVGGGGLISGIAYVIKTLKPSCKVYGVEAAGMNSMQLSLAAGKPVTVPQSPTLADGIAVRAPGDLPFAICKKYVDKVVTVTEDQITDAMLFLLTKNKQMVEGAGAVSVAAVKSGLLPINGKRVVCVVSGGNLDAATLRRLLDNMGSPVEGQPVQKGPVNTDKAPKALGPYSQAFWSGDTLFLSGQIGINPAAGKLVGNDAVEQTRQIFSNIGAILQSQGLGFKDVVKASVFAADIKYFADVNAVYATFFKENPPARSFVAVAGLPAGALVEIEVVARKR
jgi:threonine dehydratase